jgi:hypothetical protein
VHPRSTEKPRLKRQRRECFGSIKGFIKMTEGS